MANTTPTAKPIHTDPPKGDDAPKVDDAKDSGPEGRTPFVKTDEFGATVETMVVVQPLEEEEDDTCYIEFREPFTDENGVQHQRIHRVPRDNWDKYSRKHGF